MNAANRKLLEDVLYRVRTLELEQSPGLGDAPLARPAADRPDRWEH